MLRVPVRLQEGRMRDARSKSGVPGQHERPVRVEESGESDKSSRRKGEGVEIMRLTSGMRIGEVALAYNTSRQVRRETKEGNE